MKKIIILSSLTSFLLAGTTVTNLTINQTNKIENHSKINTASKVSQGETDITNNANVNDVEITQKDSGNLITNSTIENSQVYQGLTSIDNSRVEHVKLDSDNLLYEVTTKDSSIRQGNLIIGGDSNVTGTEGEFDPNEEDSSVDYINITQSNNIKTTKLENSSTIEQGVTRINGGAKVSSTFSLNQTNTIDGTTSTLDNGNIAQGVTTIIGGETSNIEQKVTNNINNISLDSSDVNQSIIHLENSNVDNIHNMDVINEITNLTAKSNSKVNQSVIDISGDSTLNGFDNYERKVSNTSLNNKIKSIGLENSKINQSLFKVSSGSNVENISYKVYTPASSQNNFIFDSTANDSELNQEISDIKNSTVKEIDIYRKNTIRAVHANDNSHLSQNSLKVDNSELTNSTISEYNLMYNITTNNANLSQGEVSITD